MKKGEMQRRDNHRYPKLTIICLITWGFWISLIFGTPTDVSSATLRAAMYDDVVNMDPAVMALANDRFVCQQLYQGLVTFDYRSKPPLKVVPSLADKYTISPDGKVITFELKKGVQFHHDYGEMTSEDVVFTLNRHLDPKVPSISKQVLSDIERIEAVDKYTVKVTLKVSTAQTFILNIAWQNAGYILSKKAVEKLGPKISTNPVGTGPFYFDKWLPGEKVILKRFEKYWGARANYDELEIWVIPEETVALGALEKGDLDVVSVTQIGAYERAKSIKNADIIEGSVSGARLYLINNLKMKPMDDLRVRRALAHALDLKGIAKRMRLVYFPSTLSPAVFGSTDEFWKYDYDLNKAKKLLAEAGYPKGFDMTFIYSKSTLYEPLSLEVANSWKKLINVKLESVDRGIWVKRLTETTRFHVAVYQGTRFAPFLYAEEFLTGAPRNYSGYSNPKVDEVVKKATTALTEEKAMGYWKEFQQIITDDLPQYWPGVQPVYGAVKKGIKGIVVTPYPGLIDLTKAYRE